MDRLLLIILVAVSAEGYIPKFRIFEIRKTKDHGTRVDDQYYDPDLTRYQFGVRREKDNKLVRLADDILKRLQRLSDTTHREKNSETQTSDVSSDESTGFVDKTRSLLIIPKDELVYHRSPKKDNILKELIQSALRTKIEDVEDRTAPPRHHIPYDDDY